MKYARTIKQGEQKMVTATNIRETRMTNRTATTSPKAYARIAGALYLLIAPLGFFGIGYVPSLVVAGDAAATANNIMASISTYRLSIVAALLTQVINILVVLALYRVLKPAHKTMPLLMVVFFLVSVPLTMLNEVNHIAPLLLLNHADTLTVFTADQLQALVLLFLGLHKYGVNIASIFWGLWLFPMGYAVFKSGYLPKILGILLMIGCVGYLADFVLFTLFPTVDLTVAQFTFIGELLLPLWLVIKGVNVERWEERVREPAGY
jgi:hypothetical protein